MGSDDSSTECHPGRDGQHCPEHDPCCYCHKQKPKPILPPENAFHLCTCGHIKTVHQLDGDKLCLHCRCQQYRCDHTRCGWKPREDKPEPAKGDFLRCRCTHFQMNHRPVIEGGCRNCACKSFALPPEEPPLTPEEEEQAPMDRIHPADCVHEDGCQYMEPTCENGCKVAADKLVREASEYACEDCLRGAHGPNAHREHRWSNPVPGTYVVCLHCCIREQDWDGESVCPGEAVDDEPPPPQPDRRPPYAVTYSVQGHLYEVALPGDATVRAVDGALVIQHHLGPVAGIVQVLPVINEESA